MEVCCGKAGLEQHFCLSSAGSKVNLLTTSWRAVSLYSSRTVISKEGLMDQFLDRLFSHWVDEGQREARSVKTWCALYPLCHWHCDWEHTGEKEVKHPSLEISMSSDASPPESTRPVTLSWNKQIQTVYKAILLKVSNLLIRSMKTAYRSSCMSPSV